MSRWLHNGIDFSQVTSIKTTQVWDLKTQHSLWSTLFATTPTDIRQHVLDAVREGLAKRAFTVYHWSTRNGGMHKLLAIPCNQCFYAVHGTWTNKSRPSVQCSLSRLCFSLVCPNDAGVDNLPHLPPQHSAMLTHQCLGPAAKTSSTFRQVM